MKIYNITKDKADKLFQQYALVAQYSAVVEALQNQMAVTLQKEVLPEFGLKEEDFPYCNVNVEAGRIEFDDEKKKAEKKEKKE
jgi:hypothetical protein